MFGVFFYSTSLPFFRLEPEGLPGTTNLVYPNGLCILSFSFHLLLQATALPENLQLQMLKTIKGLEKVELSRPGYS